MNKAVLTFKVDQEIDVFNFLRLNLPNKSRNNIKTMFLNRRVYVNKSLVRFDYMLKSGDVVYVILRQIVDNNYCIDIIYEDDYFIGINKPSGLLSVPTLKNDYTAYGILKKNVKSKLFVLHRLDCDTSGILLFCKNERLKNIMQDNWNDVVLKRGYLAIVVGKVECGTIKSYLYEDKNYNVRSSYNKNRGKLAITHYQVIESNDKYSLVQIFIDTGRKNQIRVHMSLIGTPILGDKKYGNVKSDRLYLHANTFSFIHPITKRETIINCVPLDFSLKGKCQ